MTMQKSVCLCASISLSLSIVFGIKSYHGILIVLSYRGIRNVLSYPNCVVLSWYSNLMCCFFINVVSYSMVSLIVLPYQGSLLERLALLSYVLMFNAKCNNIGMNFETSSPWELTAQGVPVSKLIPMLQKTCILKRMARSGSAIGKSGAVGSVGGHGGEIRAELLI